MLRVNYWSIVVAAVAAFLVGAVWYSAFKIAEVLLRDDQDLIHKATGWALHYAGDNDLQKLLGFLDKHARTMPRTALRYTIEHLDKKQRAHYLSLKKVG